MAELGDDGLAELGDHDVEGERRGLPGREDAVTGALGDWTRRQGGVESGRWRNKRLVAGELRDRFPGAVVVDECFASRGGGDERGDGGIVQGAG